MKTTIYLVRHTETVGNVEDRFTGRMDYEITEKGRKYIDNLTERLKNIRFDAAYSSTTLRTKKTIQKLADLNHIKIIESEKLCEMDYGDYDGMKWEDVDKINPDVRKTRDSINVIMHIPNQESFQEVEKRMYNEIKSIVDANRGKTILICSHGVAIENFLRKITGEPFTVRQNEYGQRCTTVNVLEYDDIKDEFAVLVLNDYSHIM